MAERQYQLTHIDEIVEQISIHRKVLAQLPTGGGKTFEFSLLAQRYIRNTEKSVLILVHREELMHQAAKTIQRILGINPHLITSDTKRWRMSRVYIGMVQSTVKRLNMFDNVGLVIIDEAHEGSFKKVHSIFLEERILGFSATPISSSKRDPLNNYYSEIVCGPQISELIKLGFLCQNITTCPKDVVDSTMLEVDKLKGDFNESKMAAEFGKTKYVTRTVEAYFTYSLGKKTLIFNVNKEHSKKVTECFIHCGFNARNLDSDSEDRAEIFQWFKTTKDAILCSVMIPTVGFDEPTVETVFLNYSTLSLVKLIQTAGRGSRIVDEEFIENFQNIYPYELEIKKHFRIIDMGGNCIRFNTDWCDDRDWKNMFHNPSKAGDGIAPVKTCPNCEGLLHASKSVCNLMLPNGQTCLHVFDKKKKADETTLGEMLVITKNIDVHELEKKNSAKYEYFTFFEIIDKHVNKLFELDAEPNQFLLDGIFDKAYEKCSEWAWETKLMNINGSQWHIKRALNHYTKAVEKRQDEIKKQLELAKEQSYFNCHICGGETDHICESCTFPVCELHADYGTKTQSVRCSRC